MRTAWFPAFLLALTIGLAAPVAAAGVPAPLGDVVSDYGKLLTAADATALAGAGETLWSAHGAPLVIVTLESMHGYGELPQTDFIAFTTAWQESWEFDSPEAEARMVMLFVSKNDRIARIVCGEAYGEEKRLDVQMILVDHLVPHLKKDEWSVGVRETAEALAEFATSEGKSQKWVGAEKTATP